MKLLEVVNLHRCPERLTGLNEIHMDGVDLVGVVFGLTFEDKHFSKVIRAIHNRTIGRSRTTDITRSYRFNFIQASEFGFKL